MVGLGKYFNSETYTGRANVAKATYASFALLYVFYRVRRGLKQEPSDDTPPPEAPFDTPSQCPCDPCKQYCVPHCPPQSPPVSPPAEEPKLSIPEDPLFKPQRKCECEEEEPRNESNGRASKPKTSDDDVADCK